jgi:hypothetical protein
MIKQIFSVAIAILTLAGCASHTSNNKHPRKNFESQRQGFFKNEIKPIASKPCFEGAYYRKLVSSTDDWVGIEGTVILPQIKFDENRKNPKKPMQYLDNPSVYLGGNMDGQETDIGLTWEVIKDKNGNITKDRKAFRPFLRRNNYKEEQNAVFEYAPGEENYYFYPGEEVRISLKLVRNKTLRFSVESKGKKFERDFTCKGFVLGRKGEFKRVNAIDQVGNEGRPVQSTNTQILNATWKETNLFRNVNNQTITVPFHSGRYTEMLCPSPSFFKIEHTATELAKGAETLTISGNGKF